MRWGKRWMVAAGLALVLAGSGARVWCGDFGPRVDIWTDRGTGGMYRAGEGVEIHVMPYEDCYVIVYDIDTDGYLRVLFPRDCHDDCYLAGGRTYTLGGGYRRFYAKGPSGVEYIHVVASYEPFRQIYWDGCDGYQAYAREVSWRGFHDYYGSALPPRVYGDPYVAMQTIDEFICVDALEAGLVWADFTYFYVGERVHYPRYLCYDCHGFGTHVRPYADVCVGFSVSFVDCDPFLSPWSWWWWCRPERVYCGPRFVCHWTGRHVCGRKCTHGHDHGSTDVCKDDHGSWPSEYKWKSRAEAQGRTRSAFPGEAVVRGGNLIDAARVRNVEGRDKSLYTRSEVTRSVVENWERASSVSGKSRSGSRSAALASDRDRDSDSRASVERSRSRGASESGRDGGETRERAEVRSEEKHKSEGARDARPSGGSEVRRSEASRSTIGSILSRLSGSEKTRSGNASTRQDAKGTKPQVRRGSEGKSPAARRTLSR